MQYILFDDADRTDLFPLTMTRPCAHLRIGIDTIHEKWASMLGISPAIHTVEYLSDEDFAPQSGEESVVIKANLVPSAEMVEAVQKLACGEAIMQHGELLAARISQYDSADNPDTWKERIQQCRELVKPVVLLRYPEHIFLHNGASINADYQRIVAGRTSQVIPRSNRIVGDPSRVFLEESVRMECAILNTENGPIHIGAGAHIMEGSILYGPLSIGAGATVKLASKLYSNTTIGPQCKIGGEVKRAVFMGFSNKGHEGFVGDSVIGHWCNFGAGSNISNMKNTYGSVHLWDIAGDKRRNTGEQFCGLMMGDHSKCGINTHFTTGSVVGVFANIFDTGPEAYTPSFTWGSAQRYDFSKAISVARKVLGRRHFELTEREHRILSYINQHYS